MTTKKPWADTAKWLSELYDKDVILNYAHVGSTYTLGHGRDVDFAVLVDGALSKQVPEWLPDGDWELEGSDAYEGDKFVSFRRGNVNIIVMVDSEVYAKYKTAMEVCKALKLKTRWERVVVCRIVRDGASAEAATETAVPGEQE